MKEEDIKLWLSNKLQVSLEKLEYEDFSSEGVVDLIQEFCKDFNLNL